MSGDGTVVTSQAQPAELPAGWRGGQIGDHRATYAYGSHIEINIEPRYRSKRSHRQRRPTQFRTQLRKRYYAHELVGKSTLLGTTEIFEDAVDLAYEYMEAFVEDRREVAMETREELEADPVMAPEAEETIITEAATEAAITVAGYSDDLLINDLSGLLENGDGSKQILQAVVHREGRSYDIVFIGDGYETWGESNKLREFYKQFDWLNEQKLSTTLEVGELTMMMGLFDDTRMIRYLASEDEETLILIEPNYPLHVPPFERQVADIISAKWDNSNSS